MGMYDWMIIINLIAWGYLFLLLIDFYRDIILCVKKNKWNVKFIFRDVVSTLRATCGIGSISAILFSLALVWLSKCDEILQLLNMPYWSNDNMGMHIGSFYSLIFFIPAFVLGYMFKKDFAAELFMKLSGIFSFIYITGAIVFALNK